MIPLFLSYAINTILFYSLGLYWARRLKIEQVWIAAILINAALGYTCFWIYFFSPFFGKIFGVLCVTHAIWVTRNISRPIWLALLIGSFYLAMLNVGLPLLTSIQTRFLEQPFPQDNELPFLFAEKLFYGQDLHQLISPYLSSDRPPLQTGLVLMGMPIWGRIFGHEIHYQTMAMVLQLTWVAIFAMHPYRLAPIFLAFFGFFFIHSTFVWPKLFAGVLGLCAVQLWGDRKTMLSSLSFAFALLAHTGVIFVAPVFLFLGKRTTKEWGQLLSIVFLLYLPWSLYQNLYAPPGNYVAKDLIAGIQSTEKQSTLSALKEGYERPGILHNKIQNLKVLWGPVSGSAWKTSKDFQYSEFFHLARVFGILGLLIFWLRGRLAVGLLVSLGLWTLALYGPAMTLVHHCSFAIILLGFWLLLEKLQKMPVPIQWSIVGTQVFQFFYLWSH